MKPAAVLLALCLAALCWPLTSQERTVIPLGAIDGFEPEWMWSPEMATKGCVVGQVSVDREYSMYWCVPDRLYMLPGHRPSVWLRFRPDPTFLPQGYLP